jgi:hypothetical protein
MSESSNAELANAVDEILPPLQVARQLLATGSHPRCCVLEELDKGIQAARDYFDLAQAVARLAALSAPAPAPPEPAEAAALREKLAAAEKDRDDAKLSIALQRDLRGTFQETLRDLLAENAAAQARIAALESQEPWQKLKDIAARLRKGREVIEGYGYFSGRQDGHGWLQVFGQLADQLDALAQPAAEKPERPPMLLATLGDKPEWFVLTGYYWIGETSRWRRGKQFKDIDRDASDPEAVRLYDADLSHAQ